MEQNLVIDKVKLSGGNNASQFLADADARQELQVLKHIRFTFVVNTDEDFAHWCEATNEVNGVKMDYSSVLVRKGTHTSPRGSHVELLKAGTRYIEGEEGSVLVFNEPATCCIDGTSVVNPEETTIKGLHVKATDLRDPAYNSGFKKCNNLLECVVENVSNGFDSCDNITNSKAKVAATLKDANGFINCRDIVNCYTESTASSPWSANGYKDCQRIVNSEAHTTNTEGAAVGYRSCKFLTNCYSDSAAPSQTYNFVDCENSVACTDRLHNVYSNVAVVSSPKVSTADFAATKGKIDSFTLGTGTATDITAGTATINGTLTVNGNIINTGTNYETHTEEVYSKNDTIILRDGAPGPLTGTQTAGIKAQNYDPEGHVGVLGFDANGVARVGDEGSEQPIATREESPAANGIAMWDSATQKFKTVNQNTLDVADSANARKTTGKLKIQYTHSSGTAVTEEFNGSEDKVIDLRARWN